jgi:uncharacterized membrane protein YgdD (TMEM256/DUF423 family)
MIEIQRKIFITATLLGLVAIVLGAFAAHGLRLVLPDSALESFQTGVRYQMYHAFFLFVIGLNSHLSSAQKKIHSRFDHGRYYIILFIYLFVGHQRYDFH